MDFLFKTAEEIQDLVPLLPVVWPSDKAQLLF